MANQKTTKMISTNNNKKNAIVMKKVLMVAKKQKPPNLQELNSNMNKTEKLDRSNLTKISSKSLESTFECVICQARFVTHKTYLEHFRMHGKNEIDIKGRPILESTLLKHPRKNPDTVVELIECEWCPEAFSNISRAIQHKFRKHKYESTNYFCKHCGKLFPLKCALNQHIKLDHEDVNVVEADNLKDRISHQCKNCAENFFSIGALTFHEKSHKMEEGILKPTALPPPSKKIKVNNSKEITSLYYCHLCGAEYMVKYNLKRHLEDNHTLEEKNYVPDEIIQCKACEAIFYNKMSYELHNANHKPDDMYITSEDLRQKLVCRVDQDFDLRRVPMLNKLLESAKNTEDTSFQSPPK